MSFSGLGDRMIGTDITPMACTHAHKRSHTRTACRDPYCTSYPCAWLPIPYHPLSFITVPTISTFLRRLLHKCPISQRLSRCAEVRPAPWSATFFSDSPMSVWSFPNEVIKWLCHCATAVHMRNKYARRKSECRYPVTSSKKGSGCISSRWAGCFGDISLHGGQGTTNLSSYDGKGTLLSSFALKIVSWPPTYCQWLEHLPAHPIC